MLIVDIETSGTNPLKHSIISLGAFDLRDPQRHFSDLCRIWDGAHIMDEALNYNGFHETEITDQTKQSEGQLIERFLEWAMTSEDHTVAGQNPHFDFNFIQQACARSGLNFPLAKRLIDLHSICYFHMIRTGRVIPIEKGRSSLDSDKIMDYVGIPAEPKPHQALNGAKWETEAFHRLFFDQPLFEEFSKYPVPWVDNI